MHFDLARLADAEAAAAAAFDADDLPDIADAGLTLQSIDLDADCELARYLGTTGATYQQRKVVEHFRANTQHLDHWVRKLEKGATQIRDLRRSTPRGPKLAEARGPATQRSPPRPQSRQGPRPPSAPEAPPQPVSALAPEVRPRAVSFMMMQVSPLPVSASALDVERPCSAQDIARPDSAMEVERAVSGQSFASSSFSEDALGARVSMGRQCSFGGVADVDDALIVRFSEADPMAERTATTRSTLSSLIAKPANTAGDLRKEDEQRRQKLLAVVAQQRRAVAAAAAERSGICARRRRGASAGRRPPSAPQEAPKRRASSAYQARKGRETAVRAGSPAMMRGDDWPMVRWLQKTSQPVAFQQEYRRALDELMEPSPPPRAQDVRRESTGLTIESATLPSSVPSPPAGQETPAPARVVKAVGIPDAGNEQADADEGADAEEKAQAMRHENNDDAQVVYLARRGDHAGLEASGVGLRASARGLRAALFAAAKAGSVEVLNHLLGNEDVEVHWRDAATQRTALHFAAEADHLEVCSRLEGRGADPRARDANGLAPCEIAGPAAAHCWRTRGTFIQQSHTTTASRNSSRLQSMTESLSPRTAARQWSIDGRISPSDKQRKTLRLSSTPVCESPHDALVTPTAPPGRASPTQPPRPASRLMMKMAVPPHVLTKLRDEICW